MGHAILKMQSGVFASFEAILSEAPISQQPWFIIQCERGEIVIDGAFDGGFGVKVYSKDCPTGEPATDAPQGWSTCYEDELKDFIDRCRAGVPDVSSAEYGLGELEITTAMLKSSEIGAWVKVKSAEK